MKSLRVINGHKTSAHSSTSDPHLLVSYPSRSPSDELVNQEAPLFISNRSIFCYDRAYLMNMKEFAQNLLLGTSLEDKLIHPCIDWTQESPDSEKSLSFHSAPSPQAPHAGWIFNQRSESTPTVSFETPLFPGRPERLRRLGKSEFPSVSQLKLDSERGKILHFFANHELLALELMALVLLKFPHAPLSYRKGVIGIMQEEQNHLRLYLSRMRELGVDFGDLPINDYFWNCMKDVQSPLDFTVQMSLTFEQANLDFSLFYFHEVSKIGDLTTAQILERVYREEIGHVKHGLQWFNHWRPHAATQSDWEEYQGLLPYPLNPQRAKGTLFSEEARREAGLSETFIQELKIYSGSKGRPPSLWLYNSHCDGEIARGKSGYSPSIASQKRAEDLAHIPLFLARPQDILITHQRPSTDWIREIQEAGFSTPDFLEVLPQEPLSSAVRADKLAGFEPWGWSPKAIETFRPLKERLIEVDGGNSSFCQSLFDDEEQTARKLKSLFSKSWSTQFLRSWMNTHPESRHFFGPQKNLGESQETLEGALHQATVLLERGSHVMLKAPFGTSGMQNKRVQTLKDLSSAPLLGWMKRVCSEQGSLVVEPYLKKIFDLSLQFEVKRDRIQILEARRFITGNRYQYQGTYLGKKMIDFEREHYKLFHRVLDLWHELIRDLGHEMRTHGYLGPAGVDAMIYEHTAHPKSTENTPPAPSHSGESDLESKETKLFFKPLVELNPRWTMGRVALELEKHIDPRVNALWKWTSLQEVLHTGYSSLKDYAEAIKKQYPLITSESNGRRVIHSGILITNDLQNAHSLLTFLWVNPPLP